MDSVSGNDGNNGLSEAAPWRSIAKVNAIAFNPGDSVLFKKGSIWREQLLIKSSGTAAQPIVFGSYGEGSQSSRPIISAANLVNPASWTRYKDNIYVANIGSQIVPNQLYVDGSLQEMARTPNKSYLLATDNSVNQYSVIDKASQLPADVIGATLVARSSPWSNTPITVTNYNAESGTITGAQTIQYVMRKGYGYYFRDLLSALDAPSEWFYDKKTGNLYLWLNGNDNPSNHIVEITARYAAINITGSGHIRLSGLSVAHAFNQNINATTGTPSGIMIDNVASYGARTGINLNCNGCSLQNNSVYGALTTGIYMNGSGNMLANNTVDNTGNLVESPDNMPMAILTVGSSVVIRNNTMTNNGYIGLRFGEGSNNLAEGNVIARSCLKLDDCGAIHMFSKDPDNSFVNNIIRNNRISDSVGHFQGTPYTKTQAEGIYIDGGGLHDVLIENNIVTNVDNGIFLHNAYKNTLRGNKVFGGRSSGLYVKLDMAAPDNRIHSNVATGNVFETSAAYASAGVPIRLANAIKPSVMMFGSYDSNLYCHPGTNNIVAENTTKGGVGYTLDQWRAASGFDAKSSDVKAVCPNGAWPEANVSPVKIAVSASPDTIFADQSSTVTWKADNAGACSATGSNVALPVTGSSSTGVLRESTHFGVTCAGSGGAPVSSSVQIKVLPNLLLDSNNFTTSGAFGAAGKWSFFNPSVSTPNAGIAPDGTNTAWMSRNTKANSGGVQQVVKINNLPAGQTFTFSIWAKQAPVNPAAGLFIQINASGGAHPDASIGRVAFDTTNEWKRFSVTVPLDFADRDKIRVHFGNAGANRKTYLHTTTPDQNILVWGSQFEYGSSMTNYSPRASR